MWKRVSIERIEDRLRFAQDRLIDWSRHLFPFSLESFLFCFVALADNTGFLSRPPTFFCFEASPFRGLLFFLIEAITFSLKPFLFRLEPLPLNACFFSGSATFFFLNLCSLGSEFIFLFNPLLVCLKSPLFLFMTYLGQPRFFFGLFTLSLCEAGAFLGQFPFSLQPLALLLQALHVRFFFGASLQVFALAGQSGLFLCFAPLLFCG